MSTDLSRDLAALRIDESAPQASRSWTWLLLVVALLGLVAVAYLYVVPFVRSTLEETEVEVTQIVLRSEGEAATGGGGVKLVASGYVVPRDTAKVGAKVEGRIDRVLVREGDAVTRGEVLLELDETNQANLIAAAEARLAAARARARRQRVSLEGARRTLGRERQLLQKGVATPSAVEDLETQVELERHSHDLARAEVDEAEAELAELRTNLEHRKILAPIDGVVISSPARVGQVVSPISPPLLEIADLSSVVVEVDVPEGRMGKVELGGPCSIVLDARPDHPHRGEVLELGPVINRAKATVVTRVRFVGDHEGVLPNMAARVSFLVEETEGESLEQTLEIPASAIVERDGTKVVFVIDGERVRTEPIEVGPPFGRGFELIAGPPVGTRVVSNPPEGLTNGQRITQRASNR